MSVLWQTDESLLEPLRLCRRGLRDRFGFRLSASFEIFDRLLLDRIWNRLRGGPSEATNRGLDVGIGEIVIGVLGLKSETLAIDDPGRIQSMA